MIANVSDRLNNTSTHNHSTNNWTQKTAYIEKAFDILISKLRQSLTQLEQSIELPAQEKAPEAKS